MILACGRAAGKVASAEVGGVSCRACAASVAAESGLVDQVAAWCNNDQASGIHGALGFCQYFGRPWHPRRRKSVVRTASRWARSALSRVLGTPYGSGAKEGATASLLF